MRRSTLIALALVLVAASASAGVYTVTMTNGSTFQTRYKPETADWDSGVKLLITDNGNWIALRDDEIAGIVSSVEESGFGYQVDTTTIYVGWSPNDLVEKGEDGKDKPVYEASDSAEVGGDFSIDQFIDIREDGYVSGGGVPLYDNTGSVEGGGQNN